MQKTFCDICGKETRWDGRINVSWQEGVSGTGHFEFRVSAPTKLPIDAPRGLESIPADVCLRCFLTAVKDALRMYENNDEIVRK